MDRIIHGQKNINQFDPYLQSCVSSEISYSTILKHVQYERSKLSSLMADLPSRSISPTGERKKEPVTYGQRDNNK